MVLPRMAMLDTDCVGVISQVGSGTGANIEELVVYDLRDWSDWRDYRYDWSSVAEEFNSSNTLTYDAHTNSMAMTYGGVTYHTGTLSEELAGSLGLEDGYTGTACASGEIVSFRFNGDGTVQVTMVTCITGYPMSIGVTGIELSWTVEFSEGRFFTKPNSFRLIGLSTKEPMSNPLDLGTYQNYLAAGYQDYYAIRADGALIMWGSPEYVLGGSAMSDVPMDSPLELMGNVAYVSTARGRVMAVDKGGTLWGLGTMADPAAPNQPRRLMEDVAMASCGSYDTLVLKRDGTLWSCSPFAPGLPGLERQVINGVTFEKLMDQVIYVKAGGLGQGTVILADHTEWIWDQYSGFEKMVDDVYLGSIDSFGRYGVRINGVADSADGEFASLVLKQDGSLWLVASDGSLTDVSQVLGT